MIDTIRHRTHGYLVGCREHWIHRLGSDMHPSRLAFVFFLMLMCSQALAENRVALVIGNSAYQHVPVLTNPENDAGDMAMKLQGLGFDVVIGRNLDLVGVKETVREFAMKLEGADLALFYYAGHGLQVNGRNYIAPVDALLRSHIDLDFETVPMDLVLAAMERATQVNLVFLDACRDNPLADNLARSMGTRSSSVSRGLAKIGGGVGTLIAFATQPGNVALDGTGRNSPFTAALLRNLGKPGRDITRELIDVRREVLLATQGRQVPWDSSSLTGEVVLRQSLLDDNADGTSPVMRQKAAEIAYWETIRLSQDRALFDAYLVQYPDGVFASLAKAKIQLLETGAREDQTAALSPPNDNTQPSGAAPDLVRSVQQELNRLGCQAGREDGEWGDQSRRALNQLKAHKKVDAGTTAPSQGLLEELRKHKTRICPLTCSSTQRASNGSCVAINAPSKRSLPPPATTMVPPSEKKIDNCPADAQSAARETFVRGSGGGRTVRTATHSCGREFVCRRPSRGKRWNCDWM
ncbi:caspase domain-containing protein [Neorhizobium sp. T786]|uniref:caspase family protein n=1 Tax=Pseudorhizobium xiangyangii TaxID=2883104 RepID=UPI001CFF8871|nr:caspase domain-containing protein [Neorhizobium xiangyangii]MCB5205122.1 caspase domain-containing protein [Neorhizobium xiangyangii]